MARGSAKVETRYVCDACGSSFPKWMGRCPDCGGWDTLEELKTIKGSDADPQRGDAGLSLGDAGVAPTAKALEAIVPDAESGPRWATGIGEFDRVLGGSDEVRGIVPGSAVLIGGDPGIGKSTLLLQAAGRLAMSGRGVLYVTSEESEQQLKLRADRLYAARHDTDAIDPAGNLHVLADTNVGRVLEQARRIKPDVIVVDSIQMIYKGDLAAGPGSVTQLRQCCLELIYHAKASGSAMLLVGHVTKQGQLAGPRLLEHMVDTVVYFEGDRYHAHRVVRAVKNRFGTTLEVGLFEMTDGGLSEVAPGRGLLTESYTARAGSVVTPVYQGSRCLLVEVQALTATGMLGSAKRKVSQLDSNRLSVLIAVLEKHGGLRLADQDVFVSSVGGVKVVEPAADLALSLAIAGAHLNRSLPEGYCALGEVGLGGEIRHVSRAEARLMEAVRLGFKDVVGPAATWPKVKGVKVHDVKDISAAMELLM